MKCVKASERLPNKKAKYYCRQINTRVRMYIWSDQIYTGLERLEEKELSISESNEKLNEYANKMKLEFSKPHDFALGWRLCFDWMLND